MYSFFVTSLSQSRKGLKLYWVDDNSGTFPIMKETSSLENIFKNKESENILKETPPRGTSGV